MRALAQAAEFISGTTRTKRWRLWPNGCRFPKRNWAGCPKRYPLFLDQSLLLAMEDEARWLIDNRLTDQTKVPDYLDYFSVARL